MNPTRVYRVLLLAVCAASVWCLVHSHSMPEDDSISLAATGASCDACGASATYSEALVDQTIQSQTVKIRKVTSTGCPNHYSYCTGKSGVSGCGGNGVEGTASEAKEQTYSLSIMANPVFASTPTDLTCVPGMIGIARNGISIYSGWVSSPCNQLDVNSATGEWTAFDFCSGHSEMTGQYHYHFPPSCLLSQLSNLANGHSPQVGWAMDGFPVYGPKGPFGTQMITCAQSSGTPYCLDSCSGYSGLLPTIDNFRYRYYFTGNTSDLSSLPSSPKPTSNYAPYSFACYKGCTVAALTAGTCSSNGTAGSLGAPTTLSGMTTKYKVTASNRKCYSSAAGIEVPVTFISAIVVLTGLFTQWT